MSRVLVYELNEVPWSIIDRYVELRPKSTLAALLARAVQRTTVDADPVELMPWRTWPTFHCSLPTTEHNSYDQGQDPATFRGVPMWDVADRAGKRVGLFGLLQTWPPHPFRNGGFFVPDCFAHDASTIPRSIEHFQRFNIDMTTANIFESSKRVGLSSALRSLPSLARLGLRPHTLEFAVSQLAHERRDPRYLERRSVVQALVAFDAYWALHRSTQPDLSMFFTNHVASMLHRFWRDVDPDDAEGAARDRVRAGFVDTALDIFDAHLGRIARWLRAEPGTALVVASSMGQGPCPPQSMPATYVLDDAARLVQELRLPASQREPCMYPRITLRFDSSSGPLEARAALGSVHTADGAALFRDVRTEGRTCSFEIAYRHDEAELPSGARWRRCAATATVIGDITALGVSIRGRSFGGDSGHHIPEGILFAVGDSIPLDPSRSVIDVLDAAPTILGLLGVGPDPAMHGSAGGFDRHARALG